MSDILSMFRSIFYACGQIWMIYVEPYYTWWATGLIIFLVYRFYLRPLLGSGAGSDGVRAKVYPKKGW